MEAVQGCNKTLTFESDLPCETCGMGLISGLDISAVIFLSLGFLALFICNFIHSSFVLTQFILYPNLKGIIFNLFICLKFSGGAGVPPGTKPETCRTCRGSGMVCLLMA